MTSSSSPVLADEMVDRRSAATVADLAEFDAIYRENAEFLWAVLRRLGIAEGGVEDALQDVFLVVFRKLPTFEGRSPLRSWLYGVAVRVARAHSRRAKVRSIFRFFSDGEDFVDPTTGPERVERDERLALVDTLLAELPAKRREVFVLAEIEQLSAPEIATIVGTNVNTVYSRLRLARVDFERALTRHRARDGFWRDS